MALTVSTAPQYAGNLAGGTAAIPNGTLQNLAVPIQGAGTPIYDISTPTAAAAPTNNYVAPTAAQTAEATRIKNLGQNTTNDYNGYVAGANQSAADNRIKYGNDSASFATGIQNSQNGINNGRAANQLNLRRTMSGIAGGIKTGLRSGGVSLANMNALDSGAADAMARAYATVGNAQSADANNQSQLKENEFNTSQTALDTSMSTGMNTLKTWRDNETARVSNALFDNLTKLEAQATQGGVNGAVDMGARDRLIAGATAELNNIDGITHATLGNVHGYTPDEARAKAMEMDTAGQVAAPFTVEGANGLRQTTPTNGPQIGQFGIQPVYRKDQQTGLV